MPLSWNEIRTRAVRFANEWKDESSESAEAKTFWDEFFQVFGVSRRRLASFEKNVEKAGGRAGYIDLFWPSVLIAEHKSRGKDLDAAFGQAIDYFPGLRDKELPRYVVVSDFARFRITDLESSTTSEFELHDLPDRVSEFGFIAGYESREFREQDPVNVEAAEKLARLHDKLGGVGYASHELEVYLVRVLFCLFADDTGIFMPRGIFEDLVRDRTSEDGSDLASRLVELFHVLNTEESKRLSILDEHLAAFPYVNGALFSEVLSPASFDSEMRSLLLECCELDWGKISPAIFGSLFQGIVDKAVRRNLGAHYTSEANIKKVVGPLFMDELWKDYEKCRGQTARLERLHEEIAAMTFFDPACGCGNFLVIAYRELRLLELEIIKSLHRKEAQQLSMDAVSQYVKVSVEQFYGIEIEEWPAQIARVAMWLIDHQMNLLVGELLGQALVRIPLTSSAHVVHANALSVDWASVVDPSDCDFVFGNPPFLGKKEQSPDQKRAFKDVVSGIKGAGVLDFVSAWFVKAAKFARPSARCAFVATSSVTQGEQVGVLWSFLWSEGFEIDFAHRTFKWSNEARGVAAVHCVIIGFSQGVATTKVLYDYPDVSGAPLMVSAKRINPYLLDGPDTVLNKRSSELSAPLPVSYGSFALDDGNFTLDSDDVAEILSVSPGAKRFIKPFVGGRELLYGEDRWCLWLKGASATDIRSLKAVKDRVEAVQHWRASRDRAATVELSRTPSLFAEDRQPNSDYVALPTLSSESRRYIPAALLSKDTIASNQIYVIAGAGLYEFGVLMSEMHMSWIRVVAGRLESRYRYSAGIVYNNYPWPQKVSSAARKKVETAAQGVLDARVALSGQSLADLYDAAAMPPSLAKAHSVLDKAVDAAYAPATERRKWRSDALRVAFLFQLYKALV